MLRLESSNLDRDGKPIQERVEDLGNAKYSRGFRLLSTWIEQNLDIYKVSKHSSDMNERKSVIQLAAPGRMGIDR
jgi:hypothetical protein